MPNGKKQPCDLNYKDIFFIGNLVMEDDDFLHMLEHWENHERIKRPIVVCFSSTEPDFGLPFRVQAAAHYSVDGGHCTRRENLCNYQLILTKAGRAHIAYDGKDYTVTKDTAMLVDCQKKHVYQVDTEDFWEYKHIHFIASDNQRLIKDCLGFSPYVGMAEQYFDELVAYASNEDCAAPYIYSNIINNMLTALVVAKKRSHQSDAYSTLIENAASFMRSHFMENLSVREVAEAHHLSVYYFIKLFKEHYSLTPHKYLFDYRINRAKEMLLMGATVEETANACGFGSLNNFYKAFKSAAQTTPKMFVKSSKAVGEPAE